jgi:hypothetical protein
MKNFSLPETGSDVFIAFCSQICNHLLSIEFQILASIYLPYPHLNNSATVISKFVTWLSKVFFFDKKGLENIDLSKKN